MGLRSRSSKTTRTKQKASAVESKAHVNDQTAQQPQAQQQRKFLVQRVLNSDLPLSSEDAVDAVHWIRQIMAIFIGTAFGILQLKGFPAILTFFSVSLLAPTAILSFFHELDLEEINKHHTIQTEGALPSMALFILSWTLSYTVFLPQNT
ncbi:unnamed protein product [Agarophyton chilense]